jgi:hypothetical protein
LCQDSGNMRTERRNNTNVFVPHTTSHPLDKRAKSTGRGSIHTRRYVTCNEECTSSHQLEVGRAR